MVKILNISRNISQEALNYFTENVWNEIPPAFIPEKTNKYKTPPTQSSTFSTSVHQSSTR